MNNMEKEIIEFRKICEDAVEISRQTLRQILKENAVKEEANNDDIWEKMKEFE